jgi:hypothetical protein
MTVDQIDPLRDERWVAFLQQHPDAAVFHTPSWLEALQRTYGYEPVVFTTSASKRELTNGLAFCRINGWLRGRRLVSLPFSDHCQPLVDNSESLQQLLCALQGDLARENWKYIEIRPRCLDDAALQAQKGFEQDGIFYFHKLDLRPALDELFRNFHKTSVQQSIRRAQRESLTYEEGRSEALLAKFYHLLLLTRRRHHLPPQPLAWFQNLIDCFGDKLKIRVASKGNRPVASILTLFSKDSLSYKYGCSDAKFNHLGGIFFLLWQAIQEAKAYGAHEFDMGRSDCDNAGLITFKDRWGTTRSMLTYYRYPASPAQTSGEGWKKRIAKEVCTRIPDRVLTLAGKLLYKHFG